MKKDAQKLINKLIDEIDNMEEDKQITEKQAEEIYKAIRLIETILNTEEII